MQDPIRNTLEIYGLSDGRYVQVAVCRETDRVVSPTLIRLSFDASRIFEE